MYDVKFDSVGELFFQPPSRSKIKKEISGLSFTSKLCPTPRQSRFPPVDDLGTLCGGVFLFPLGFVRGQDYGLAVRAYTFHPLVGTPTFTDCFAVIIWGNQEDFHASDLRYTIGPLASEHSCGDLSTMG